MVGFVLIKRGKETAHKCCMLTAFGVSFVFLVLYVTDKVMKGGAHTPYHGQGAIKIFYYCMLSSHVLLAMTVPIFAVLLIWLGFSGRRRGHRRLARIAWPIWMYVSITGVLIYLMLYYFNPTSA